MYHATISSNWDAYVYNASFTRIAPCLFMLVWKTSQAQDSCPARMVKYEHMLIPLDGRRYAFSTSLSNTASISCITADRILGCIIASPHLISSTCNSVITIEDSLCAFGVISPNSPCRLGLSCALALSARDKSAELRPAIHAPEKQAAE